MEKLEDAGLLSKDALLAEGRDAFGTLLGEAEDAEEELATGIANDLDDRD